MWWCFLYESFLQLLPVAFSEVGWPLRWPNGWTQDTGHRSFSLGLQPDCLGSGHLFSSLFLPPSSFVLLLHLAHLLTRRLAPAQYLTDSIEESLKSYQSVDFLFSRLPLALPQPLIITGMVAAGKGEVRRT